MTLVKWCLLSSGVTVSCISHVSTLPILLKQIHLKADHSRDAEDDATDSSVGGRNGEVRGIMIRAAIVFSIDKHNFEKLNCIHA